MAYLLAIFSNFLHEPGVLYMLPVSNMWTVDRNTDFFLQILQSFVFSLRLFETVTPKYLILSTFLSTLPSKVVSMDLSDSFTCQLHHNAFDLLEPLSCLTSQVIDIILKF